MFHIYLCSTLTIYKFDQASCIWKYQTSCMNREEGRHTVLLSPSSKSLSPRRRLPIVYKGSSRHRLPLCSQPPLWEKTDFFMTVKGIVLFIPEGPGGALHCGALLCFVELYFASWSFDLLCFAYRYLCFALWSFTVLRGALLYFALWSFALI